MTIELDELKQKWPVGSTIMVQKGKTFHQSSSKTILDKTFYGKIQYHHRKTVSVTADHNLYGLLHCRFEWADLEVPDKPVNGPFGPIGVGFSTFDNLWKTK